MCVLALAWKAHHRWHLVAVANRDELHARPSAPLRKWRGEPSILAGQDEVSGGTWLGLAPPRGRFCAVTNVSGHAHSTDAPSRGKLVESLLVDGHAGDLAANELARYNGFNLVAVADDQAWLLTNVPEVSARRLDAGFYGLSNGLLSRPWPKVAALEGALSDWMESHGSTADLLDLLAPPEPFSPLPGEPRSGAPLFIENEVYGTRCSTVVAVSASGEGSITERRFDANGEVTGETTLSFGWAV
jgi:uncharacterized protein with NRDE domain